MRAMRNFPLYMVGLVAFLFWVPGADAYLRYNDGCQDCHGAFTDAMSPNEH
jgi:hypothetical protein